MSSENKPIDLSWGKKILFSCLILIIFLVLLELASYLYVTTWKGNDLRDHYFGGRAFEFFAPTYIRLRSGGEGQGFHINQDGIIGHVFSENASRSMKVLAIGGSTSFGDRNYMGLIAERYDREGKNQCVSVKFASAGTPGYSSLQSLINLQTRLLDLRPDIIFIYHGVNDLNHLKVSDARNIYEYNGTTNRLIGSSPNFRDGLLDKSYFYTLFYNRLLVLKRRFIESDYDESSLDRAQNFGKNLESMIAIAKARGMDVVLGTFAHNKPQTVSNDGWGHTYVIDVAVKAISLHNSEIIQLSKKHNLLVADISQLSGNPNLFRDLVHMNVEGTERKAEIIYPIILQAIARRSLKEACIGAG